MDRLGVRPQPRPNEAKPPSPHVVELGCWVCRVLDDAVKAQAVDVAMYEGMIVGARIGLGAPPVLCGEHAARWERIGMQAGLSEVFQQAGAQRPEPARNDPRLGGLQRAWVIAHEVAESSTDSERKLGALSVAGKIHDAITLTGSVTPDVDDEKPALFDDEVDSILIDHNLTGTTDQVAAIRAAFDYGASWPRRESASPSASATACSWCWRVLPEHEAGCEAVELAALRKVAEAARELVSEWDWQHLLVDHPDSEQVREDVARVDSSLAALSSSNPKEGS